MTFKVVLSVEAQKFYMTAEHSVACVECIRNILVHDIAFMHPTLAMQKQQERKNSLFHGRDKFCVAH
jgi:hypothetical protein